MSTGTELRETQLQARALRVMSYCQDLWIKIFRRLPVECSRRAFR